MIYNLYKQRGETPLECIRRFAKKTPELKGQKMTYLGRLDPLAEGVLLMASGEDTSQARREEFFGLDKAYDFVAIFGFATDSYDILGKIVRVEKLSELLENDVRRATMIFEGEREQEYPFYSSKMIAKRKNKLKNQNTNSDSSSLKGSHGDQNLHPDFSSEDFPQKKVIIHKIQFHKLETLNNKELFGRLLSDISKVNGDFRQNEILILWNQILFGSKNVKDKKEASYFIGRFSAEVSSGTYIRSLVNDLGKTLGCGATTLSIKRTRVGDFKIEESLQSF
ncbi:MAG: hypothetical protein WC657_04165 [Candidatus Paceibacterota bacterium]|jgi:tRNA pseudouridine55 synthase